MAETIIRKSTACETHGDRHDKNMIRRQKNSYRGPMKIHTVRKGGSKRSRKY